MRFASLICAMLAAASLHAAPGLQVRIMLERVDHSLVVVSPAHEFHSGDRIHLRVGVSQSTTIYVLTKTEADFAIDPAALRDARSGEPVFGPVHLNAGETDLAPITFDDWAGVEHLYVVAAARPDDPPIVIEMALRHAN